MQADLVLTGGKVYTVDARRSRHEALAVKDGRIVALGSAAEAAEWAGPRTRTVDLGGRLVLPGFVDAHLHPVCAVNELYEVSLADCESVEQCLDRVAAFAAEHPELPVIRGYGWFPTRVPTEGMTAEALDRAAPGRPVLLNDDNVHAQWVSSEVLRRAGIGREDPDWPGAVVERLPDGSPKGLLHEAYPWVERALPAYTAAQHEAAFAHFRREIVSRYGITCLHEAGIYGSDAVLDAYERLERDDELGVRLRLAVMMDPDRPVGEQVDEALQVRRRFDGPLVSAATAKFMVDGVIETHTAYLAAPYDDRPGFLGDPVWPPDLLVEASRVAAEAGLPAALPRDRRRGALARPRRRRGGAVGRRQGHAGHRHPPPAHRRARLRAHGGRGRRRSRAAVLVHQGSRLRRGASARSSAPAPTGCTRCAACSTRASRWRRRATTRSRRRRTRCSPSSAACCAATRSRGSTPSSGRRRR